MCDKYPYVAGSGVPPRHADTNRVKKATDAGSDPDAEFPERE